MHFQIRALDEQQRPRSELLEADNAESARQLLQQRGWLPLTVQPQRRLHWRRPAPALSLGLLMQELHSLLIAGLNLGEALDALAERDAAGPARSLLDALRADLRRGLRLSDAAERQPAVFPALLVGMLRAAEHTGDLPQALQRYLDWRARVDMLRARVISAAIYPAILLVAGGTVTLFLMLQVVPSFAEVYRDNGRSLPWASGLLMRGGLMMREHLPAIAAGLLLAGLWIRQRLRGLHQRGGWLALAQRLPGLSQQVQRIELARLYLTLGMLLEGGIPVLQALMLARHAAGGDTAHRLQQVAQALDGGLPLSHALELAGLCTPVAQRLLRVGERTGQLGTMLTRAAQFHDGENQRFVERFTKAFEPALMALIGLIVAAIVVLLYLPIFDLVGSLQ